MSSVTRQAAAALVALSLAASLGCGGAERRGRVLLVGIDGASPIVAGRLLGAGRLPQLGSLARDGVFATLRAHRPINSPRIWTSIATGKRPAKHGILGFARAGDSGQRLYRSDDRQAHALWNIASDAGLRVGVVNWWNTYPLEDVRGVMVSDHLLPRDIAGRSRIARAPVPDLGPIVHPADWAGRLAELLEDERPLTDVPDPFRAEGIFPAWVQRDGLTRRYESDARVTRVALAVEREIRPDLLMVFLPGIDRVSHVLWGALVPTASYPSPRWASEGQQRDSAEALRRYYEYSDALIGRLLARFGPDDLVMVVSDHGFEAGGGLGYLTGVHHGARAIDGVVFARGPGIAPRESSRPMSVDDVTPTVLAWLGLPVADDMDGRPAHFLDGPAPARIATYDTQPIERRRADPSGAEEEILKELEALGYLDDADSK